MPQFRWVRRLDKQCSEFSSELKTHCGDRQMSPILLPSFPSPKSNQLHLLRFTMSKSNVFQGAHDVAVIHSLIEAGPVVRETCADLQCQLINANPLQITNTFAASPLFTGRRDILANLKQHFSTSINKRQQRKCFLLHGTGGIGKTQICLRFIEEMSGQ
jgi:primosomal protein N'